MALARASHTAQGMVAVINATGVILHTNLGRAPLPERAARAAARAARSYTDVEVDRESGRRGHRGRHAETLLKALTGAEAAIVVNNCAAALLLAMASLAKGKQVIVSRGELIEIGGEFRIPDILAASGARLAEVGTTNRTRIGDYRSAIGDRTRLVLKVHPSNYRMVGFTAAPSAADLATLAHSRGIPFLYDIGSGLLHHGHGHPNDEPSASDALDQADLVTFSADKLLGGPQAGIVVGRRRSSTASDGTDHVPCASAGCRWPRSNRSWRSSRRAGGRDPGLPDAARPRGHRPSPCPAAVGDDRQGAGRRARRAMRVDGRGGSMPGTELASWGVRIQVADAPAFAARGRARRPPSPASPTGSSSSTVAP